MSTTGSGNAAQASGEEGPWQGSGCSYGIQILDVKAGDTFVVFALELGAGDGYTYESAGPYSWKVVFIEDVPVFDWGGYGTWHQILAGTGDFVVSTCGIG